MSRGLLARSVAAATGGALALVTLAVPPALAAVSPEAPVVINEVYGGGGNSGSTWRSDFVELVNSSDDAVSLDGWSVQYASAAGSSWQVTELSGTVGPGEHFLVKQADGAGGTLALPTPDVAGSIAMSGTNAKVALVSTAAPMTCSTGCAALPDVVDYVGIGSASDFAGSPAPAMSNAVSVARTDAVNTADNGADFVRGEPTPTNLAGETASPDDPEDPEDPEDPDLPDPTAATIAEIQGEGEASGMLDTRVTTTGVVTAAYPTGGLNGIVIQTPGPDETPGRSDAIFVYLGSGTNVEVAVGQHVRVTGTVAEYYGLTQVVATRADVVVDDTAAGTAQVVEAAWPATDAEREALESMLFLPTGEMTVTNTYSTNQYGEVGLAAGAHPLLQPTDVARPGTDEAAAVAADNAARAVTLDDGASLNFLSSANQGLTPPYVSLTEPVRVGATASFTEPVIVDYRNSTWKLNPTSQVVPGAETVAFSDTRTVAPDAGQLGDGELTLASFNVLNYFTTLGSQVAGCTAYTDRAGDGVTTRSCPGNGPRGAWDADDLERQQAKIVAAINATDADVVGLMEIENSVALGEEADEAVRTLVAALNAAAGADTWSAVASSADLPPVAEQDVITNAIIYRPDAVSPVGDAVALGDQSGQGEPFVNAREPIGQIFEPADGGESFLVVVNHFKSKGSAGPLPGDEDAGDGQGSSNASRVAQATALRDWVPTVLADAAAAGNPTASVALVGDFNSYTREDPLEVLYDAGFVNARTAVGVPDEYSYSFSGQAGSLDHILLNEEMLAQATGADIWEINAPESIALEYSRYNSHGTLFYDASPFRSSDHDPVLVSFSAQTAEPVATKTKAKTRDRLVRYGDDVTVSVTVRAEGLVPSGSVEVLDRDEVVGSAELDADGRARIDVTGLKPGKHRLTVRYAGSDAAAPSQARHALTVLVLPGATKVAFDVDRDGRGVDVRVTGRGFTPEGTVYVLVDGRLVAGGRLDDGRVEVQLGRQRRGVHVYTVLYLGSDVAAPDGAVKVVRVR